MQSNNTGLRRQRISQACKQCGNRKVKVRLALEADWIKGLTLVKSVMDTLLLAVVVWQTVYNVSTAFQSGTSGR